MTAFYSTCPTIKIMTITSKLITRKIHTHVSKSRPIPFPSFTSQDLPSRKWTNRNSFQHHPLASLRTASTLSNETQANSLPPKSSQKTLTVTIVGPPNAGKSQLLNTFLSTKISAVSRKRHTTRDSVLGAYTKDLTQLCFLDTPGFSNHEVNLPKSMTNAAAKEMSTYSDYALLVMDAAKNMDNDGVREALVELVLRASHASANGEFGIVLNKVDLISPKKKLLPIVEELGAMVEECLNFKYQEEGDEQQAVDRDLPRKKDPYYPEFFMVSALHDDGVSDITKFLLSKATKREWILENPLEKTDVSPLQRVEEVIREKIYRTVHREIPHQVTQVNRIMEPIYQRRDNGVEMKKGIPAAIRIHQDLVVKTKSHHRILTGSRGGMTIKKIEKDAKKDLEDMFGCPVDLALFVKLSKNQHARALEPPTYREDGDMF